MHPLQDFNSIFGRSRGTSQKYSDINALEDELALIHLEASEQISNWQVVTAEKLDELCYGPADKTLAALVSFDYVLKELDKALKTSRGEGMSLRDVVFSSTKDKTIINFLFYGVSIGVLYKSNDDIWTTQSSNWLHYNTGSGYTQGYREFPSPSSGESSAWMESVKDKCRNVHFQRMKKRLELGTMACLTKQHKKSLGITV